MAVYRTQMKIIGEILECAQADQQDGRGTSVTYLIRKANVSHTRISQILGTLVSQGLLEQTTSGGASKYRISQTGRDFLREYYAFTEFASSFGLSI